MNYTMYTDGACSGNPGRGGWAAVVYDESGKTIIKCSGGYRMTTNNRMEILAVAEGLKKLHKHIVSSRDTDIKVTVCSDSQLVVNSINLGWSKSSNKDLWDKLQDAIDEYSEGQVVFQKVKGHSVDEKNNLVDQIAVAASQPINAKQVDSYYEDIACSKKKETGNGKPEINKIVLENADTEDKRMVKVYLTNGTEVKIVGIWGGFEQYNCTTAESAVTVDVANRFKNWLNGGSL